MPDFLLELLSEEIPARMQAKARADLQTLFEAELARDGLTATDIETYATPRRLVLQRGERHARLRIIPLVERLP